MSHVSKIILFLFSILFIFSQYSVFSEETSDFRDQKDIARLTVSNLLAFNI